MKHTPKSLILRCLVILLGTIVAAFGCASFVKCSSLGLAPVDAFIMGLGGKLGTSYGMTLNIVNLVLFVFLLIFNRKMIHFGTIIYTLLVGTFSDMFIAMLTGLLGEDPALPVKAVLLLLAVVTFAFGLGLYQSAQLGAGPIDGFNQTIAKWTKVPLKYERIGCDVLMALMGFLLGSTIFVGTILGMFAVGPIMGPTITRLAPVVDKWADGDHSEADKVAG